MASIYEQIEIIQDNMETSIENKVKNIKAELEEGKATNLLIHEQMKLLYDKIGVIKQTLKENSLKNDRLEYLGLPKRHSIETFKHFREEKKSLRDGYESDSEGDDEDIEDESLEIAEKAIKVIFKTLSFDEQVKHQTNLNNVRPILRQIKLLCRKSPKSKLKTLN
jgi:hypothetical protein